MSSEYDPFKFDTGLKDDYDGTITEAEFKQSDRGSYNLHLTVTDGDGEESTIVLGLFGKDWVSVDGGETVEGRKTFDQRAKYAKFIAAAMGCGAEKELRERSSKEFGGRGPMHAGLWVGMKFHFDVVEEAGNVLDEVTKEWKAGTVNVVRPTKYLGVSSGAGTNPSITAQTRAGASTPATASNIASSNGGSIHPTDLAALTSLAQAHPFMEWVDKAMMLKGVDGELLLRNNAVKAMLSSEEQYNSLRG